MPSNALQPLQQDPQFTSASKVRGMDFTNQLSLTGDTLTGTPTVSASVMSGTDPSPGSILIGAPSISSSGMQVLQRVSGGVGGTAYVMTFLCPTAQGNTLVEQAFFWILET